MYNMDEVMIESTDIALSDSNVKDLQVMIKAFPGHKHCDLARFWYFTIQSYSNTFVDSFSKVMEI